VTGCTGRTDDVERLLDEQAAYYRVRALDYDEVYTGREHWDALVDLLPIRGDVLELACGTGRWTGLLAARARTVTAVDAAPEMLDAARRRTPEATVTFVRGDALAWSASRAFDTVFFGFWLSHVPPQCFAPFWEVVRAALRPGGSACFIDSAPPERDLEDPLPGPVPLVRRRARDGRDYRVVKVFYEPAELTAELLRLGWRAEVRTVHDRFYAGSARPSSDPTTTQDPTTTRDPTTTPGPAVPRAHA
jgi:SAM-dependent methyltransferase